MSVKKEPSGRRSVQVEVEVPGSPEEVWQAIATGPGISAWFVPTEFIDQGGPPVAVKTTFGPGMESTKKITAWDPPRLFAAEGAGWGPNSPPIATEWSVEARSGGICVVRVVHSLFASTDDWNYQLEGTEKGWPTFFRILRLYLTHFPGQTCVTRQWMVTAQGTEAEVWAALMKALGLTGVSAGERWEAASGAPRFAGVLEYASQTPYHALVRLDTPGPGALSLGVVTYGKAVMATLSFYHYGPGAATIAAQAEPSCQEWIDRHFPKAPSPAKS